jgi:glycosyltransferase involved in cell wall biosynthesis
MDQKKLIASKQMGLGNLTLVMPSAFPTGGAEEALLQVIKAPASREFSWQVVFLEHGPLVDQVKPFVEESLVVTCGRTRNIWRWWKASKAIERHALAFQSDLILGWMTKGHVYGGLAAWLGKIPAAWFQMGLPDNGLLDWVSRRVPSKVVFTCSEFAAREQRTKQPSSNVIAIPLGVDLSRFEILSLPSPAEARKQLGLPSDGPIIGIVGRLQHWKGMHTLIDAMPRILVNHPESTCVIVGGAYPAEPKYESFLKQRAKKYGLESKIIFAGSQVNVPIWMQAMDIVVHASIREPFGIVVVEAMSLGKSVIASVPGGPAEVIRDGKNGFLSHHSDHQMLADKINLLLDDSNLRNEVGRTAINDATHYFSSTAFAQRLTVAIRTLGH